jgi:hypothetical protein
LIHERAGLVGDAGRRLAAVAELVDRDRGDVPVEQGAARGDQAGGEATLPLAAGPALVICTVVCPM